MRRYAIEQGVSDEDIVLDYVGRRTYDTCYRADTIFGVQNAILVTQWLALAPTETGLMHLDRVTECIPRIPVTSSESMLWAWLREIAAVSRAWLDLNLLHPMPVLGEKEPIF